MAKQGGFWRSYEHRKQIAIDEKVTLELTERARDLIIKHTFARNNLTDRLRIVPGPGRRPFYHFTLDELAGYVAAEANHAKVKKLEKELRQLYTRIVDVLESYTDEPD